MTCRNDEEERRRGMRKKPRIQKESLKNTESLECAGESERMRKTRRR